MADKEGASWFFKLIDGMSGPADKITYSLEGASKSFKALDKLTADGGVVKNWHKAISTVFGKETGDALFAPIARGLKGLSNLDRMIPLDLITQVGGGLMAAGGILFSAVESLVSVAATIGLAVGAAVIGIGVLGFKFAAEAADFKRNTLFGLETMLGTGAEARKTLEELEAYTKRTGLSKDSFVGFATNLLKAGFQKDELKPLLGALSDVQAANGGDVNAANKFFSQIERIKETDKTSARQLVAFGSLGLDSQKIFQALADQQHITLAQAKLEFDKGKVNSKTAIDAILTAVSTNFDQGGKLGSLGEKFGLGSIAVQFTHLHDAFTHLFENVNTTPFVNFLQRLNDGLAGGGAEKIEAAINRMFASISKLFEKVTADDIANAVDKIATGFEKATTFTEAFFTEVIKDYDQVKGPLGELYDTLFGNSDDVGIGWRDVLHFFEGMALGSLLAWEAVAWFLGNLVDAFGTLWDLTFGAGINFVQGLWEGIKSAWDALIPSFESLIDLLPSTVRKVLGIQSPSTVMFALGYNTGEGFTGGLDKADIGGAMDDAVQSPSPATASIVTGPHASRGGGGTYTIEIHQQFVIDGKHDIEELAEAIRPMTISALSSALEQLGIEQGS